jgi:uncharacterized protein YjbI with pentapeptide repeats
MRHAIILALLFIAGAAGVAGAAQPGPPQPGPPLLDSAGHPAGGWWALRPVPAFDPSGQRRLGRIRALPPTSSFAEFSKARPVIADFASQQIDGTALFDFHDPHHTRVFYQAGTELDVSIAIFNADLNGVIVANEAGSIILAARPLDIIDLGHYRILLETTSILSKGPEPFFLGASQFGNSTLKLYGNRGEPAVGLQVLFRFYPDASQVGGLNEGEVALFQECNYRGKAIVFAADMPNFSELTSDVITVDRTTASVKLGNNTAAALYNGAVYTGTRSVIKADTPCLPGPHDTTSLLVRPLDRVVTLGSRDCTNCRLVGANLANVDLSGVKLDAADLTNANVSCANFSGTDNEHRVDLTTTVFTNAQFGTDPLCRTLFTWTILNADTIPPAQWRFVTLANADINGLAGKALSSQAKPLDLAGAILSGASLTDAILDYAKGLSAADLTGINLTHASLRNVDFSGSQLSGATLDRANLEDSNLSGAVLSPCVAPALCANTSLRGAHLKNANLTSAHLENAVFIEANLYSTRAQAGSCNVNSKLCASARNATLTNTQFDNAYLFGTDFGGAFMHGATFDGAVLVGANFEGAHVVPLPNGKNSSFANAFLQGASLAEAVIDGVTLSGALLDFRPQGNTMFMQLNGNHTGFAGWATPGEPVCTRITYGAWASVPEGNSTITCPDGTAFPPDGCGKASSSAPLNPHWDSDNNRHISTNDPKASYQSDATYTMSAPNICVRNIAW